MATGILCPICRHPHTTVKDSRPSTATIRRRRACDQCGARFSTLEVIATDGPPIRAVPAWPDQATPHTAPALIAGRFPLTMLRRT